jgi:hypothetical protein
VVQVDVAYWMLVSLLVLTSQDTMHSACLVTTTILFKQPKVIVCVNKGKLGLMNIVLNNIATFDELSFVGLYPK